MRTDPQAGAVRPPMLSRTPSDRPWPVLEAVALVLALLVGWRLVELHPALVARAGSAPCLTHCQARLQQAQLHGAAHVQGAARAPAGETGFPARDDSFYTTDARAL